jgi:hypothetical protein
MKKFNKLIEDILLSKIEAPNYRFALNEDKICTNCKFNNSGFCTKFNFKFMSSYTCDTWEGVIK